MIRIREIADPDLRQRVRALLAEQRGCQIPDWFELDDADFVDVLNELRDRERPADPEARDPRM
jgi:hypothetical protein